ncbi:unnamed protein product, partial [Prorocentrum cordatum]
ARGYEDDVLAQGSFQTLGGPPLAKERGVLVGFDRRHSQATVKDGGAPEPRGRRHGGRASSAMPIASSASRISLALWALSAAAPAGLYLAACERESNRDIDADFRQVGLRRSASERGLTLEFPRRIAQIFERRWPARISELELEAAAAGAWWRRRDARKRRRWRLRLLDAQAAAAVCAQCRSRAWRLRPDAQWPIAL